MLKVYSTHSNFKVVKKTLICISSTHWRFLWQRPQQIMSRLSRYYNILYVDPPATLSLGEYSGKFAQFTLGASQQLISIHSSLKVLSVYQLEGDSGQYSLLIADQIKRALISLRWQQQPLLWIYNLAAASLIGQLGEASVVYDCVDDFTSFSWAHHDTKLWEAQIIEKSDVILTSARALYEARKVRNWATFLVPNAADFGHFSVNQQLSSGEPGDLKKLAHPRFGFSGAAYEWLDFQLLEELAVTRPQWQFVMIGPCQHGLKLPQAANIHWLGTKEYKLLPWYLQQLDVMIIPFLRNQTTEHANPIKLWEYLAAGKPVVSTKLPEVPQLENLVWLSADCNEFRANCQQALNLLNDPGQRLEIVKRSQTIARENSWEQRCAEIRKILHECLRF